MPRTKNAKKNKSRKATKSLVGPVGTVTVPRGPAAAALPVALRSTMRYFANGTLAAGAANTYIETVWRSNSLFDPDYSGVGTQPAGFAALATLYARYRVLGVRVVLTVVNDVGGSVSALLFNRLQASSYASLTAASTQGFVKKAMLSDQSGGRNQTTFREYIRPWEVLGVTKERYMLDDQYSALYNATPSIVSYLGLGIHAVTVTAQVQYQIDLFFDAVVFDRNTLA